MSSRKTKRKKNKLNKTKFFISITILLIICVLWRIHYIYSLCGKYDKVIYPGVKVEDVDLSQKSKEEAIHMLREKYGNTVLKKNIVIKTPRKNYSINYAQLNAKYNIEEVVNKALSYGKDKKVLEKFKLIKSPQSKQYKLKFDYDDKYIGVLIGQIENTINKKPKDSSLRKVGDVSFDVTSSKDGQALNTEKLKNDINSSINGNIGENDVVINAEIKVLKPKVEDKALKSINSKISTFSTTFDYSAANENRAYNVDLATKSLNGTLIMPGDTFSFNDIVGERSAARGYKGAPVIIGNKVESGLGGGVCQVSTTLYNAIIRANIPSTERTPHTMPSHYVDKGMDATVSYGSLDYKFKNTLKYPVYIESYTQSGILVCNVYSNSSLSDTKYDLVSEVYETIQPNTIYVEDATLSKGTQVIDRGAKVGYRVKVYKVAYKNGTQISKDFLYKDYYKPIDGIIKKGVN